VTHFENLLIILVIAVIIVSILRRFHLPPILGYLLAGALIGPAGLQILETKEDLHFIAEFGVVFLLFTIGLELSFPKLISMRKALLGLGGLQVFLCTLIALGIAYFVNLDWPAAIAIAGALTLSSTAVASKQLVEQNELHQEHGKLSLSILLFQDLAAVPFLIVVPAMVGTEEANLGAELLTASLKGAVVFFGMLAAGRWLLRPLFHYIAAARSSELFMLAALLVVLASSYLTEAMGLSLALGAFLAGVMLAETEYAHQIELDILPFRDILLGLFFLTVGMMVDIDAIARDWPWILMIVTGLIVFKTVIIALLGIFAGATPKAAIRAGLVLAQGGEFGFALLAIADKKNIISLETNQIVITSIILSIAIAPIMIRNSHKLAKLILSLQKSGTRVDYQEYNIEKDDSSVIKKNHVIVCGYGRVGQTLSRFLEHQGTPFIGLDLDPLRLREAKAAGEPVFFGDVTNKEVLISAGIKNARLLMISFNDPLRAEKILYIIRAINKDLPVLVRTDDDRYLEQLLLAGATEIVPDKLESSLMLASHMLMLLGTSPEKAQQQIWEVKTNRYKMLRGYFYGHDDRAHLETPGKERLSLHAVELTEGAYIVGKTLENFIAEKTSIQLASFFRNGYKCDSLSPNTILQAKDVLVLIGNQEELYLAEEKLLQG